MKDQHSEGIKHNIHVSKESITENLGCVCVCVCDIYDEGHV